MTGFLKEGQTQELWRRAAEKARAEYMSHVTPEVQTWAERCQVTGERITPEQYKTYVRMTGLNAWEREYLTPWFDDALLVEQTRFAIANSCPKLLPNRPDTTYDSAVIHRYAPELLRRLEAKIEQGRQSDGDVEYQDQCGSTG